ncbi:hypothetical protein PIROE2DRAFT_58751 [Piromyces sp. E2]|nr:hypothetical protein PIROE2DRAFT_58751 [Piromyces sp. E2]|eukprot:OUM67436.1 hypothetical protein PIROE2DRAFT_58751 [Piromyces sp. E2]
MSYDFSVKPIKAFRSDLGKVNIIVTGKLGVGKSTLINAMFGKEFARTGEGRLITKEIKEYSCGEYPVSLIDTKGIELSSYKNDINDIEKYVKQHQESKDTHSHIHVAWVCIPEYASRIEDVYKELIGMLSQYMPVIAVITKLGFDSELQNTIKME